MTLSDALQDPIRKEAIIKDALAEVDTEVNGLSGLKGKAMKAGYQAVQKLRPGFLESNLDRLLPKFAPAIDPHYEAGLASGDVEAHFVSNADQVANDLLAITDERAAGTDNKAAASIYNKMRKGAKDQVVNAMPRIGAFVARHGSA